jgi:hypothetical protein
MSTLWVAFLPQSWGFNLLSVVQSCGHIFQFTLKPYGDTWRRSRKLFTRYFNQPQAYKGAETRYVNRLLVQLLDNPKDFYSHLKQYAFILTNQLKNDLSDFRISLPGAIMLETTYGINVKPLNDPYVKLAEEMLEDIFVAMAERHFVDIFPALKYVPKWFPGAGFQRFAAESRKLVERVLEEPVRLTERDMVRQSLVWQGSDCKSYEWLQVSGKQNNSFVATSLENKEKEQVDRILIQEAAGAVYLGKHYMPKCHLVLKPMPAGSETTTSTLQTLFLAMLLYPNVQKALQSELDKVFVGRLPDVNTSELDEIPYLLAVIYEVYRCESCY